MDRQVDRQMDGKKDVEQADRKTVDRQMDITRKDGHRTDRRTERWILDRQSVGQIVRQNSGTDRQKNTH